MKQHRIWFFVIVGLLLLSLVGILLVQFLQKEGDLVNIYQDGVLLHSLPLGEDRTIRIESESGGYNVVTISEGKAWISEASCPDQVCVHHGPTTETADPIVCLPNKLVVQIVRAEQDSLDGVSE